jgi:hypothetical protein
MIKSWAKTQYGGLTVASEQAYLEEGSQMGTFHLAEHESFSEAHVGEEEQSHPESVPFNYKFDFWDGIGLPMSVQDTIIMVAMFCRGRLPKDKFLLLRLIYQYNGPELYLGED